MFWYNYRGYRGRRRGGWGFFPLIILLLFVGPFLFHQAFGFVFMILPFLFIFWVVRSVMRRASGFTMWNNQGPWYQGPQQSQQPYYQQPQQPYYQSYQEGYQPGQQSAQPEVYQEGGQQYRYEQYEQPQAQYPQEMPPIQQ